TTSRSTSLSGPASPRAWEPKRMTCSGSNRRTIRLTMRVFWARVAVHRALLGMETSVLRYRPPEVLPLPWRVPAPPAGGRLHGRGPGLPAGGKGRPSAARRGNLERPLLVSPFWFPPAVEGTRGETGVRSFLPENELTPFPPPPLAGAMLAASSAF